MKYFEKLRQLGVSPFNFDDVIEYTESKSKNSAINKNFFNNKKNRNVPLICQPHEPIKLNCRIGRVYPASFFY